MIESAEQLENLIRTELERFRIPEMREFVRHHLVALRLHYRRWEYSRELVSYPCWLIADLGPNDLGLAYSEYGHGKHDPWGVIFISGEGFGGDDSWFLTLEDAAINSSCWHGAIPEDYEIS